MTILRTGQSPQPSSPALSRTNTLQFCVLMVLFASGTSPLLYPAEAASLTRASLAERDAVPGTGRREIVDPCLGFHWQLIPDPSHAGRPGRLVLLNQDVQSSSQSAIHRSPGEIDSATNSPALIILAGAHVIVHQETGVVRARLNAIALESVGLGQRLRVRLLLGTAMARNAEPTSPGMVVSALATGYGEVRWTDSSLRLSLERGN